MKLGPVRLMLAFEPLPNSKLYQWLGRFVVLASPVSRRCRAIIRGAEDRARRRQKELN